MLRAMQFQSILIASLEKGIGYLCCSGPAGFGVFQKLLQMLFPHWNQEDPPQPPTPPTCPSQDGRPQARQWWSPAPLVPVWGAVVPEGDISIQSRRQWR